MKVVDGCPLITVLLDLKICWKIICSQKSEINEPVQWLMFIGRWDYEIRPKVTTGPMHGMRLQ